MNWQRKKLEQRLALFTTKDDLPDDLQEAIQRDPELRTQWEQSQRLVALISLKQYEQPESDVASRCRSSVLRQLRSSDQEESYPFFDWGWDGISPLFRVGLAALFLVLVGLQLKTNPAHAPATTQQADLGALPFPQQPQLDARRTPAPASPGPDFSVMMVSNWFPRIQQPAAQFDGFSR